MMETLRIVVAFFAAVHLVLDFPLQGDTTAREKNHRSTSELQRHVPFGYWLAAHAAAHALGVAAVVHLVGAPPDAVLALATLEFFAHGLIDHLKCRNAFGIHVDQLLHLVCKIFYAWILVR